MLTNIAISNYRRLFKNTSQLLIKNKLSNIVFKYTKCCFTESTKPDSPKKIKFKSHKDNKTEQIKTDKAKTDKEKVKQTQSTNTENKIKLIGNKQTGTEVKVDNTPKQKIIHQNKIIKTEVPIKVTPVIENNLSTKELDNLISNPRRKEKKKIGDDFLLNQNEISETMRESNSKKIGKFKKSKTYVQKVKEKMLRDNIKRQFPIDQ